MTKSPEQLEAETKSFILKAFCIILVLVSALFTYSIIFIEQPLFNEAPADKQIFSVLGIIMTQIFTVLSLVLTGKSSTPPPPIYNPCPPMGMQPSFGMPNFGMQPNYGFATPSQDNSTSGFSIDPTRAWSPPPPPSMPPSLEHDEERERMSLARAEVKNV